MEEERRRKEQPNAATDAAASDQAAVPDLDAQQQVEQQPAAAPMDAGSEVQPEGREQVQLTQQEMLQLLAAAAAENKELLTQLQRLQADFDNYRRRTRKEKEMLQQAANENLILALLDVLDNFDRALEAAAGETSRESLLAGVQMIARQIREVLGREGLQPFTSKGEQFDPAWHDAAQQIPAAPDQADNMVAAEIKKGYLFKDKVLRPAVVVVARKEIDQADEENET